MFRFIAVTTIVLVLAFFSVLSVLWDRGIAGGWSHVGIQQDSVAGGLRLESVTPGLPADKAGLRAGDLVVNGGPGSPLSAALAGRALPTDRPTAFRVERDGKISTVMVTASPSTDSPLEFFADAAGAFGVLTQLVLAAMLVIGRPTRVTWPFFWWACAAALIQSNNVLLAVFARNEIPEGIFWIPLSLCYSFGAAQFASFCALFPDGIPRGWSKWLTRKRAIATLTIVMALLVYAATAGPAPAWLWQPPYVVILGLGVLAFSDRYRTAAGDERARLRWLGAGIFITLMQIVAYIGIGYTAYTIAENFALAIPFLAIAIAYAILKHHVFDVRIVGVRAALYALLTAIPIVLLSLIDWGIGKELEQTKLATILEIAVALSYGFVAEQLQRRLRGVLDRTFFAGRRRGELRAQATAAAIAHTSSFDAIDRLVAVDGANALRLTACCVYRNVEGSFVRTAASGALQGAPETLDGDDPFVLHVKGSPDVLDLDLIPWRAEGVPQGAERVRLEFPCRSRGRLLAFVVVAAHRDGEALAPSEIEALHELVRAAGSAYDAVAAEAAYAEIAQLREGVPFVLAGQAPARERPLSARYAAGANP